MKHRLAVHAHLFGSDLRAAAAAVRRAGFAGVLLSPASLPVLNDLAQTGRRDLARVFRSNDLGIEAIDIACDPAGFTPKADLQKQLDAIAEKLDLAAGLGAKILILDLGPLPPSPVKPKPKVTAEMAGLLILPEIPAEADPPPVKRDPAFEASLREAMVELGRLCDRCGVLLAFRSTLASIASLDFARKLVDCPWFKVEIDSAAVIADDVDLDTVFSMLGRDAVHVRLADGVRGEGNRVRPTPLGSGRLDLDHLAANLAASDFAGPITIDTSSLDDPVRQAIAGRERLAAKLA